MYTQDRTLMAVPFDAGKVRTMGPAVPVVQNVRVERGVFPGSGFAVSSSGFLIHANPSADDSQQHILVWVDRSGREEPLRAPPRRYASARLSPDGTRIALDVRQDENDIWVWSLDRATLTPVTAGPDLERFPIWSPDGKRVVFGSPRNNRADNVYSQAADGTGTIDRMTTNESAQQSPQTFLPDGSLLFAEWTTEGTNLQTLSTTGDIRLLFRTPYRIASAEISPDGRLLAYASNDTGRTEVYVRPFPNIEGQRVLISTGGGFRPVWSPNGGELFYVVGTSPDPVSVMAASVESRSPIKMSSPRKLIEGAFESSAANTMRTFDVSPDGRRFLMIKNANPASGDIQPASLTVLVNWFEELNRLAPIPR
jgi:serine/threonine-protein kinase